MPPDRPADVAARRPFLFPVPAGPLRSLLDAKAQTGAAFSEDEATLDVMLALDRDDLKPIRYLMARWSWTKHKVTTRLEDMQATAGEWRGFYAGQAAGQDRTDSGQNRTRIGADDSTRGAFRTEPGQDRTDSGQYRTDPDLRPQTEKYTSARHEATTPKDGGTPTLEEVLARAAMSGVPADEARAFFLHYEAAEWMTSGKHPQRVRNWVPKMMKWHIDQPGFASSAGANRGPVFDASQPVLEDRLAVVLAAHPSLTRADFYQAGKDPRTGAARYQLRPEAAASLA